jgi:sulfatase maturation enzyme AslB (radical SAM superfamily)
MDKEKLKQAVAGHSFPSISIWGGEPLYNLPQLSEVLAFCKEFCEGIPIWLVSNGTLLKQEIVNLLNEYNVNLTISHDAYAQHYRTSDFLRAEAYIQLLKEIKGQLGFLTVLHAHNCDIEKIFKYFEEVQTRVGRPIGWSFEKYNLGGEFGLPFLPQGESLMLFSKSIDFLLRKFTQGHPFAYTALGNNLHHIANIHDTQKAVKCACGANQRLSVTTDGAIAFCQVEAEFGNYAIPDLTVPQKCKECNVGRFCAGICPTTTEYCRDKMCEMYKIFYEKLYHFLLSLKHVALFEQLQWLQQKLNDSQAIE